MKNKIDFVEGNTRTCLFQMVIPLLMAMILTMAYNLVDSLWVGNLLGEKGYAALTNSTSIVMILMAIAMGASNGIAILISQTVGAKKQKEAEQMITTLFLLASIFAIGVTVVIEFLLGGILKQMGTPSELFGMAYDYLSIYLIGYIAIYLYMHFTAVYRSYGDAVFQVKGMLISTIFNTILDPIMIEIGGLKGAAWATVISELACLALAYLYNKKKKLFHLSWSNITISYVKPLLFDAIPAALQQCMPAVSSAVMVILVSQFSITTIAAYGVTSKLEILLFYPAMAMNMALTTIVGQCKGAKRVDRVKEYMKCGLVYGSIYLAIISMIVIGFAGNLSWIFIRSTEAAAIVKEFFEIVSVGYVLYMVTSCFLGELSGMGKPTRSMILMFLYYIVIRVPLAILLVHTSLHLNGIWLAILLSHVIAAILATISGIHCIRETKKQIVAVLEY